MPYKQITPMSADETNNRLAIAQANTEDEQIILNQLKSMKGSLQQRVMQLNVAAKRATTSFSLQVLHKYTWQTFKL